MDDMIIDYRFDRAGEMIGGCISLHWLTLELLEERGILPRGSSLAYFQSAHDRLEPDLRASGMAQVLSLLIDRLKHIDPPDNPNQPTPKKWRPIVIPGGKP